MTDKIVLLSLQNEFVRSINVDQKRGRTDIELVPVLGIEEVANHLIGVACSLVGSGAAGAFQEILTAKNPNFIITRSPLNVEPIDKMKPNPYRRIP
jgi:hypothetical protein